MFVPFSFFPDCSSKISPQPFQIETSDLVYRFITTSIVKLKMGLLLFVLIFVIFSLSPCNQYCNRFPLHAINTAIFCNRFLSNFSRYFVCPSTMICCIVGLRTGILLFLLPCICPFVFLSIFLSTVSPQLFKIESLYLVYRITATSCIVG